MWTGEHTMTVQVEPEAIWRRWTRLELWNEDDPDTAWARLNGPLAVGTTGRVKPRRGPASALTITALDAPARFDCRTRLPGASMRFEHQLERTATGTTFTHRLVLTGPTSALFARLLGRRIVASFPTVMTRLAHAAGADVP